MVMIAQPTEMLLVSEDQARFTTLLNPEAYRILAADNAGKALEMLRETQYDLIVLDDVLLATDLLPVVREIRRRYPLTPVLVMSDNGDSAFQTDLFEAGASDLLLHSVQREELHRRLRLAIQQRRQNRALARRTQNLQSLTVMARRLHAITDPRTLIAETIDLACRTFKVYGLAIIMDEGDGIHIYAGREGAARGALHESTMRPHPYDPFQRVISSGFVQTFRDISSDQYFTPIPVLPRAESAIVLPLTYPEYTYGALAVFGTDSAPLSQDDLIIYELFAAQFTTALQNAQHYEEQDRRVQFSTHLTRAWQRFITLETPETIAANLRELIEDIPGVSTAVVWLYSDDIDGGLVIDAGAQEIVKLFAELHHTGQIERLFEQMDDRMQIPIQMGRGQKDPLGPLYRALRGQQLMLFPITDAARLNGGVIASSVGSSQFGIEDANLMKSLAHAAGQALVRSMLTSVMAEKSARLESILRTIYEGIVFVDITDRVAFCNTQFAELTAINPAEVLAQPRNILLDRLAGAAADPQAVRAQLGGAVDRIFDAPDQSENYSILELNLAATDRSVIVEITPITGAFDDEYLGWIAIIRDNERYRPAFTDDRSMIDTMAEHVRVPHAELRGLVSTLIEQHTRFTGRERARFLRQMERNIEKLGQVWENFFDLYTLEMSGLVLEREETDLYDVVQRVLDSRLFNEYRRYIHIEAPARLPVVRVDELRIERALSNALHALVSLSPRGGHLSIRLEAPDNEVRIILSSPNATFPADDVDQLFSPVYQLDADGGDNLGLSLHLSRELIARHGGGLWATASQPGLVMTVALPATEAEGMVITAPPRPPAAVHPQQPPVDQPVAEGPNAATIAAQRSSGYSVQKRQPKAIMIVEGKTSLVAFLRSKLESQGYELLLYRLGEEALRDVNAIRLDMIVIDMNLPDANGLDLCERMRKRTEVPIVMIADEASEAEEIRALKQYGADAFIARPISEEQLMARVDVILKRVIDIPTRTREPLDLGDLYVDYARREVFLHAKPIELTRIEYDLLYTLSINEGQVLTHKQLLDKVWGPEYQAETQYLWVNVSRLRKKLEPTPDSPRYIHTQQGVGYVFRRP